MIHLETERLRLRPLAEGDAPFILELMNQPSYHRNIGDRGLRSVSDAADFFRTRLAPTYSTLGYGAYRVGLLGSDLPIGICGLFKRPTLEDPDIGFAFLEQFQSLGYGRESATAVMGHAVGTLGLRRVLALTAPHNEASIQLILKLGLTFEGEVVLPDRTTPSLLYALNVIDPRGSPTGDVHP